MVQFSSKDPQFSRDGLMAGIITYQNVLNLKEIMFRNKVFVT